MSEVVIAPFSHSGIRDWPLGHYADLIGLLQGELGSTLRIRVIGTAGQRLRACELVRRYSSETVSNECGRNAWSETMNAVRNAMCVIGNNSGIAHVSGSLGTPTVCIFGGSHERIEWRPRGENIILLSRTIGCSPCQLDHGESSPYNKACLRDIEPDSVLEAAVKIMSRAAAMHIKEESL